MTTRKQPKFTTTCPACQLLLARRDKQPAVVPVRGSTYKKPQRTY